MKFGTHDDFEALNSVVLFLVFIKLSVRKSYQISIFKKKLPELEIVSNLSDLFQCRYMYQMYKSKFKK